METSKLDFQKLDGLIPAVIQDAVTFQVLMVGFMNEAALQATIDKDVVTFYSRTKGRLWTKGETSGNFLNVKSIHVDCDRDTVLVFAVPTGPVCHTGESTCFHDDKLEDLRFLGGLQRIIEERAESEDKESSYTARLLSEGVKRMAQKVGEEGVEVSLAAVSEDKEELLNESADLLYHLQVLLASQGYSLRDVGQILHQRHHLK